MINFLSKIGAEDIKLHIENAPQNAIYLHHECWTIFENNRRLPNKQLVTDVLAAGEFSAFADKSTNEGDHSNMAVFICFVNVTSHKVQERSLGVVKLAKSKKAGDLHDIIMKLLQAKGLDSSLICFSGLDGTNAMS